MSVNQDAFIAKPRSSAINNYIVFAFFFAAHLIAALYSPIQDCDEVFNYWEASHLLNHNYGFQTWEYSPLYAIRSWAYAAIHAGLIVPFKLLGLPLFSKSAEFYYARSMLALLCACCESRLFDAVAQHVNTRIALLFMLIMTSSTGMFHASVAYLPSSFAMYTTMLGTAEFLNPHHPSSFARLVFWFALGSILGWPFAAALILPLAFVQLWQDMNNFSLKRFILRACKGLSHALLVLFWQTAVDSYFYGKLVSVPWNIIAYNVFSGSSKGPDIFGTEPWHYYIRNLLLNFHIWFLLAILAVPFVLARHLISSNSITTPIFARHLGLLSPFYLWLAIFTLQPHKEERFMYPAYAFLAINAAFALHVIFQALGSSRLRSLPINIPASARLFVLVLLFIVALSISILRTASLATGYTAPMKVYDPLHTIAHVGEVVCLGKEWYRYPSSYFLPNGVKARFIKSEFTGLLPGEFLENVSEQSIVSKTRAVPPGMNDQNLEDPGKYIEVSRCDYLIDLYFSSPAAQHSKFEPEYILDNETWDHVVCEQFLDSANSSLLGKLIWLPQSFNNYSFSTRKWAKYCLLKRKQHV